MRRTHWESRQGIPNHSVPAVSRRQFIRTVAGATAIALGSGVGIPIVNDASAADVVAPKPIPGGTQLPFAFVHHYPLTAATTFENFKDPSQIFHFDGFVALNRVRGMGTGTDTTTGKTTRLPFQADMGFMQGMYIGEDNQFHTGAFGFI